MEWLVLGLFCGGLVACLLLNVSILYALGAGLGLFLLYGRRKGFPWAELVRMALDGVKTVKNILITFLLIGVLTALWRAAGTIPVIVCWAARLIRPGVFLLMAFLLNAGVSVLTGTSFGTAATMGVICATMGGVMGVPVILTGGAVLSGVFFGDRCSPVSTSALLVAELTGTSIFDNIKRMLKTALVPFLVSCAVYFLLGLLSPHGEGTMDLTALFAREFDLSPWAAVPAAVILILSLLRVNVKLAMGASILAAVPLCLWLQGRAPLALLQTALTGFVAADADVAAMLAGGPDLPILRHAPDLHPGGHGGLQPELDHPAGPPAVPVPPPGPLGSGSGPGGHGRCGGAPRPLVHRRGRAPLRRGCPGRQRAPGLLSVPVAGVAALLHTTEEIIKLAAFLVRKAAQKNFILDIRLVCLCLVSRSSFLFPPLSLLYKRKSGEMLSVQAQILQ